jgi:hypothetical protein
MCKCINGAGVILGGASAAVVTLMSGLTMLLEDQTSSKATLVILQISSKTQSHWHFKV